MSRTVIQFGYHFEFVPAVSSVKCIYYLVQTQKYTYKCFRNVTYGELDRKRRILRWYGTYWNMLGPKRHKST